MYAGDLTADKFNSMNYTTAYLPIASFEPHGPHLPASAGILIANALGEKISTLVNAFMLPVQPFGNCVDNKNNNAAFVDPGILYEMTLDLALEAKRQNFNKIIIHQGFNGMSVLYPLTRHLNANEGIKTVFINPYMLAHQSGLLDGKNNYHSCELHTSLMLYLHPELVNKDNINGIDFVPEVTPDYLNYKPLSAYCPNGVWGYPSLASKEKGERLFSAAVNLSVKHINDAFDFMEKNGDYTGGREKEWEFRKRVQFMNIGDS
jgi:creatinine amidohydrolase